MCLNNIRIIEKIILSQIERYPKLEIRDAVKALYQSEFGCGHFVSDEITAMYMLTKKLKGLAEDRNIDEFIEPIADSFCRVHIDKIKKAEMSQSALLQLFMLSSKYNPGSKVGFYEMLQYFQSLCSTNELSFDLFEVEKFINDYKDSDFTAVHHTDTFRENYNPAYRVIKKDYRTLIPLLCKIDELLAKEDKLIIAIDGNRAAGKTTLSDFLTSIYDCNLFHIDDFSCVLASALKNACLNSTGI